MPWYRIRDRIRGKVPSMCNLRSSILALALAASFAAGATDYGPYRAQVVHVIDGDTLELRVAIWPQHTVQTVVRLAGINAPELRSGPPCEREAGRRAAEFVRAWAARGGRITLTVTGREKYGRPLGAIARDGEDLAAALIAAGHARPYDGGRREAWC
jgi:endonuclease YncB( thermonuclease family)